MRVIFDCTKVWLYNSNLAIDCSNSAVLVFCFFGHFRMGRGHAEGDFPIISPRACGHVTRDLIEVTRTAELAIQVRGEGARKAFVNIVARKSRCSSRGVATASLKENYVCEKKSAIKSHHTGRQWVRNSSTV